MNVLKYIWGKAKKNNVNGVKSLNYHPLICHLIDVAAVAEIFWNNVFSKYLKEQLSDSFFGDQETTKRLLIFLAGTHDLGKATPIFQSKVSELSDMLSNFDLYTYSINKYHSILSGEVLYRYLMSENKYFKIEDPELILNLKFIIGGHHGIFPKTENFNELIPEYLGNEKWNEIQEEIIQIVAEFCKLDQKSRIILPLSEKALTNEKNEELRALLIFISGFISIVDWIGSNENFFNYYTEFENSTEFKKKYFQISRLRAKNAIEKIGWSEWKSPERKKTFFTFKEVFPFIKELRPLQTQIIENLDHISSPSLTIIEAPMGEGKTEAALYLEYYLEQKEDMQGAYIALPTQATANQMFLRVKDFLSTIKKGHRVNLHLLHGNAIISNEYLLLKTKSKNFDEESNVVADEWFSYRKRGLISPFGVGTIDQILLSVLPLKYFFIRLFGLAGKIIIIDEIHSYDVYMSTILEFLLYWLRLLGSSVILLSATLPSLKRKKLIKTFYLKNTEIPNVSYPRITICTEDQVKVVNFDVCLKKQNEESVQINWIDDVSLENIIKFYLEHGGRAAIICNTVKRAQDLYVCLKHLNIFGIEVELLHSRFPYIRRSEIEDSVINRYGKNKNHTESKRLLISTQIIEQSLDLDFDLMISDLAPIDLLFQRMGRLHRHIRDKDGNLVIRSDKLKRPQFFVIKPSLNENGIPQFSNTIYSKYILLKTYLYFLGVTNISIPDDLEHYIECVYDDYTAIPEIFKNKEYYWKVELETAKKSKDNLDEEKILSAKYKLISNPTDEDFFENFSIYLDENTSKAEELLQNLTRITTPSINLVCLYEDKDELFLNKEKTIHIYLNRKLNDLETVLILNYTIRVSNYPLFKHFTERPDSTPMQWKKNILIHNVHYVVLTREKDRNKYFFDFENNKVYLSKNLGLYIKNKNFED